jgi:nucleoside-diphosphate-sugar epimerase
MKIVVTGISGFVGQNLKSYLKDDFDLEGVSRDKKSKGLTYEMFLGDNRRYDAIVHLAGKAHDLKKTSNDDEYFEVNYELTKKIFDQFLNSDAQQFIFVSSVKASADQVEGFLTEETIANPVTAYGKSKQMAEAYMLANLPANKKVYILRPCMIHGPGNKGNLNLLYTVVNKGFPWPLGAFENQRSYCSIDNLCFVIRELLSQDQFPSGIYNVADDLPVSTNELIQLIATSQNKKARILYVSKDFITLMAKLGGYLQLPLNSERLQKLTENYVVSNQKLITVIGKPLPIESKEGLLKTFQSFKK